MARIFISHSAKTESEAEYLGAIADGLTQVAHQVLLDRSGLRVADDWNLRITNWMVDCHGAVVLLSPQALLSDYVKLEISNLLTRWRREKHLFPLCVVLLPGVTAANIRQGFYGAIGLADNQFIMSERPELALPALIERFAELPSSDAPSTAFEALELQLADILGRAKVSVLAGGAAAAGCDGTGCVTADHYAARLAPFLLRCSMATAFKALREFRRGLSREETSDVFALIAPSWVPPEAGRELAAVIGGEPTAAGRAVMINADYPQFTPDMYLRRAQAHLPEWSGAVTDPPHGRTGTLEFESLLYQVRVAIISRLGEDPESDEVALARQVENLLKPRELLQLPVVVPLPIHREQREVLARLAARDEFRTVTFIALCGAGSALAEEDSWLRPELQTKQEERAYYLHHAIRQAIDPEP